MCVSHTVGTMRQFSNIIKKQLSCSLFFFKVNFCKLYFFNSIWNYLISLLFNIFIFSRTLETTFPRPELSKNTLLNARELQKLNTAKMYMKIFPSHWWIEVILILKSTYGTYVYFKLVTAINKRKWTILT